MPRKYVNRQNSFCYECGLFILKRQEKIMISTMKKAYGLYFNREDTNLDKNYIPNYCCSYCLRYTLGWLKSAPMSMKFAVPMIWKEQQNQVDDCYLCLSQMSSGINRYKKRKVDYPDLNSAQRPLSHSDILPGPIPPEKEKESAYKDSKMIVEDQCGPISDKEDVEIETEAEVCTLLDSMEPILIGQEDLNDLCRDLKLTKDKSKLLGSRLKQCNLL